MNKIEAANITALNDLVYAGVVVVTEIEKTQEWNYDRKEEWKHK